MVFLVDSLQKHPEGFIYPTFTALCVEIATVLKAAVLIRFAGAFENYDFVIWVLG